MMKLLRSAFLTTIPVLTGYVVVGIAFGLLLQKAGYGVVWAVLMSVLVYAGSMQFVAVALLADGSGLLAVAAVTFFVNIRHFFYGLSFLDVFRGMGRKRGYMIFSLTDETYSLLCTAKPPEGVDRDRYFFTISLLDQIYWVTGSVIGSLAGSLIPFATTGLEFAMTALFMVILVEQWSAFRTHEPVFVGFAAALSSLLVFGPKNFLVPALALIVLALLLLKKRLDKEASSLPLPESPPIERNLP
jgi:4-azaleucine resistance transporter AzlC